MEEAAFVLDFESRQNLEMCQVRRHFKQRNRMSKDMEVRIKGARKRNNVFPSNYKDNLSSMQKIQELLLSLSLFSNSTNQICNFRLLFTYLVSTFMYYYFIFNSLRHLEYSSQYVLMQRSILILFPKCSTLLAAPLYCLLLCSSLKQNCQKVVSTERLHFLFIFFP